MGNSLLSMTDTSLLLFYGNCIVFVGGLVFIVSLVTLVCWSCIMRKDKEIPNCQGVGQANRTLSERS